MKGCTQEIDLDDPNNIFDMSVSILFLGYWANSWANSNLHYNLRPQWTKELHDDKKYLTFETSWVHLDVWTVCVFSLPT